MTTPTTPRPAPEAVEAAMIEGKADQRLSDAECERVFLYKGYWALPAEKLIAAGRILAAEVEWLRAESDRFINLNRKQGIDICALVGEVAELRAQLASHCGECGAKLQ